MLNICWDSSIFFGELGVFIHFYAILSKSTVLIIWLFSPFNFGRGELSPYNTHFIAYKRTHNEAANKMVFIDGIANFTRLPTHK